MMDYTREDVVEALEYLLSPACGYDCSADFEEAKENPRKRNENGKSRGVSVDDCGL